jgi:hypothetical protein
MSQKFLTLQSGRETLKEATASSAGAGNAGDIPALDSAGRLDVSMMPVGIAPDVKVMVATEALNAGSYVNIYNIAGIEKCRLADKSSDRPANGFVKDAVLSAGNATIYFEGANDDLTGLTPGQRQYLSTAGNVTSTPVTTGIHQFLGIAISATEINTDIEDAIVIL